MQTAGYARQMNFQYRRAEVTKRPFCLKEWDFYQVALDNYVLQITVGHVSYVANFSVTLFSLDGKVRYTASFLRPLVGRRLPMPEHPENPQVLSIHGKNYEFAFTVTGQERHLKVQAQAECGPICVDLILPLRTTDEKMVIATPFDRPDQFYLNYKTHYYNLRGIVQFGSLKVEVKSQHTALLDWGRGVWPFHQEWFWSCGSCWIGENRFGINLGWGFGNTEKATENMFFWNGKAIKLGRLQVERNEKDYLKPWRFVDETGLLDLTMTPVYDNDTQTKMAFVNNRCHQIFGRFNGTVILPDGTTQIVENLLAFCEHAVNNW